MSITSTIPRPTTLPSLFGSTAEDPPEAPGSEFRPQRLLTIPELAELLDVSVRTLHRRIADRTIHVLKLGRLVRIHPSEVTRLVSQSAAPPKYKTYDESG